MKKLIYISTFLIFLFTACSSTNYSEQILGTWESSVFIDATKAKAIFEVEDGMEMQVTGTTTEQYLRGGRYNDEGDITFRISANGQEIPIKLHLRESGSWEFHDNFLVKIAEDSKVTALDDVTRNIIANAPEFAEMIEPVKGESYSIEIVGITDTDMQVKMEDLPGIIVTYQKKINDKIKETKKRLSDERDGLKDVNIDLETKSLLNDKVELKIPKDFDIMSEELLKLKYPSERRPTLVYSNESGGINVALNLTQNQASQELIPAYKDNFVQTFKNLYPSAEWKDSGVKTINGRKVGYLELVTPAIDTEIYNLMFFTDLDGKLLLCTFNCTKKSIDKWTPTTKEIMNSLKIK